ncbi:MAG: preprotein translocase subunit SecY, partial [Actinomycetota bacterium]
MLRAFVNAFKIPDLRAKILFTLLVIGLYRLGSFLPIPNIDVSELAGQANATQGGFLSFINLFSGGALSRLAVFALGIMPYITS